MPDINSNEVKFARLLTEIVNTLGSRNIPVAYISISTGLSINDIYTLLDRAEQVWLDAKYGAL